MKINRAGIELLKKWEGLRLTAYQDSVGVWTIGYGHTAMAGLPKPVKGMRITQVQAEEILVADLVGYEVAVSRALTRVPNQNQFAAMTSLCYNIGPSAFAKSSVVKRFNSGDFPGAAKAFSMWNMAGGKVLPGLTARRIEEARLFAAPAEPAQAEIASVAPSQQEPANAAPGAVSSPPGAVPVQSEGTTYMLTGKKAYIVAIALAVIAIVEKFVFDIPGIAVDDNWIEMVLAGLGLGALRAAIR